MADPVWVLGGTGRTGTAIATRLLARGITPVLVGRSADRMQQLLTELLDLARLRSGRVELERAPIDARDIARDVVAAVEPMAAARDQRLVLEVPPTRVTVVGDRRRLEQAVLNLAANAQKFSDTGAEVVVRVARELREQLALGLGR